MTKTKNNIRFHISFHLPDGTLTSIWIKKDASVIDKNKEINEQFYNNKNIVEAVPDKFEVGVCPDCEKRLF